MKCKCGSTKFLEGPRGGFAQNVKCAECGMRYNVTPFGIEELGMEKSEPEPPEWLYKEFMLNIDGEWKSLTFVNQTEWRKWLLLKLLEAKVLSGNDVVVGVQE